MAEFLAAYDSVIASSDFQIWRESKKQEQRNRITGSKGKTRSQQNCFANEADPSLRMKETWLLRLHWQNLENLLGKLTSRCQGMDSLSWDLQEVERYFLLQSILKYTVK